MRYLINDTQVTESYFWESLQGIAGKRAKERLLEGWNVLIHGAEYRIVGVGMIINI